MLGWAPLYLRRRRANSISQKKKLTKLSNLTWDGFTTLLIPDTSVIHFICKDPDTWNQLNLYVALVIRAVQAVNVGWTALLLLYCWRETKLDVSQLWTEASL